MAQLAGARALRLARRRADGPARDFPRHAGDLVRLVLGIAIFVLTTRVVHRHQVGVTETNVFRLVNDLPPRLFPVVWPVMQLGNIVAVPVAAGVALLARRLRLALDLAVAGVAGYLLGEVVKRQVDRARPAALLGGVHLHGGAATGLGFVSGHAAVSVALATVAGPYLGRRARRLAWGAAVVVCLSRVYVGAHLPLDVVGGAALGWAIGACVHLVLGAPGGNPSISRVRRGLVAAGLDPQEVRWMGTDTRRSSCFRVRTADGTELFAKVVPRERRDGDLLYRAWRVLTRRERAAGSGYSSPAHQVDHEAGLALLAAAAGVRTPAIVRASSFGNGAGLLVERWVPARNLDEVAPEAVDDALLGEIWRQIGLLRAALIAHGDLSRTAILAGDDGLAWLVDFDAAVSGAPAGLLAHDTADALVALARVAGAERVVAAAARSLGWDALDQAAAQLGKGPRGGASRRDLRRQPGLEAELRQQLRRPVLADRR